MWGREDGPSAILESAGTEDERAVLVNLAEVDEPLFEICRTGSNPTIESNSRRDAYGSGVHVHQILESDSKHSVNEYAQSILADIRTPRQDQIPSSDIIQAAEFLVAVDLQPRDEACNGNKNHQNRSATSKSKRTYPPVLAHLTLCFARIPGLEACRDLPLSLNELYGSPHPRINRKTIEIPSLSGRFKTLSSLLLEQSSSGCTDKAFLLSSWGWRIYLGCLDAEDPEDMATQHIFIRRGMPARRGIRKTRIVDGPATQTQPLARKLSTMIDHADPLPFSPGISSTVRGPVPVEHDSLDASSVVQTFDWQPISTLETRHTTLGFRGMLDLRLHLRYIRSCDCNEPCLPDDGYDSSRFDAWMQSSKLSSKPPSTTLDVRWPQKTGLNKLNECILKLSSSADRQPSH